MGNVRRMLPTIGGASFTTDALGISYGLSWYRTFIEFDTRRYVLKKKVGIVTKPNTLKSAITNVSNNLAVDNPKFEDKAIKEALIACARQYALYFDTSGFDKLISTLPNGTWKNRTHDLKEYVKEKKPKWVRENFQLFRDKLNSLSAAPGYGMFSASENPKEPTRN